MQEEQDEADVFEDPTPPQALEGRLAGLEPIIGYPQMSLSEAVSAGTQHSGGRFNLNFQARPYGVAFLNP